MRFLSRAAHIAQLEVAVTSVQTLTDSQCRGLLSQSQFGRLGVLLDGYPQIFPVNYALDGEAIAFRTSAGSKLEAARQHNVPGVFWSWVRPSCSVPMMPTMPM